MADLRRGCTAHYYSDESRVPYERSEKWLGFFASMADGIKLRVDPGSALDVGGAHRLLVKALRDRGIDADGFDVSDRSTPSRPR